MSTMRNISFLELHYPSDSICLGAGSLESVLQRDASSPLLRVSCLEPYSEDVRFRARMGTATVSAAGIKEAEQPDPMLRLGAWVRILPLIGALAPVFQSCASELLADMLPRKRQMIWLSYQPDQGGQFLRPIIAAEASLILDPVQGVDGATVIQIVGARKHVKLMLQSMARAASL